MTATARHQCHQIDAAAARRRRSQILRLAFAGATTLATIALFDAARPDTTPTMPGSGSVRLTDVARSAPASGPTGGFAADDSDDQAQLQEQQALRQMQQSQQQAEEQNEEAEQQFEQGMQQAQMDEQQANDP
jgi:hypothetical protein